MTFGITTTEVRNQIGLGSDAIADSVVNQFISESESETEQLLKTKFTPTKRTEVFVFKHPQEIAMLRKTPICTVTRILIGGTSGTLIEPDTTLLDRKSGRLMLLKDALQPAFDDEQRFNTIEYTYARLEETEPETQTTASTGTGSSVSYAVTSDADFIVGDDVLIEGYDGKTEINTLTGTGGGSNTLTSPVYWNHVTGSRVVKMTIPAMTKELAIILGAMRCGLYMIGNTYTFATSYQLPEESVVKGVPYPHFDRAYSALVKRRDYLLKKYQPEFAIS